MVATTCGIHPYDITLQMVYISEKSKYITRAALYISVICSMKVKYDYIMFFVCVFLFECSCVSPGYYSTKSIYTKTVLTINTCKATGVLISKYQHDLYTDSNVLNVPVGLVVQGELPLTVFSLFHSQESYSLESYSQESYG